MELFAFVILAYVFIGAVATVPMWVVFRYRARKGWISRNDPRLESLEITIAIVFLDWPRTIGVIANHKTDYLSDPTLPPHLRRTKVEHRRMNEPKFTIRERFTYAYLIVRDGLMYIGDGFWAVFDKCKRRNRRSE